MPNTNPFKGQIYTRSAEFDAEVAAIAQRTGIPANWLMWHMFRESGLNPLAHVNNPGGKYIFGLKDAASVGEDTWGGGLFGLVRPYAKPYTDGLSIEEFILSGDMRQLKGFEKWLQPFKGRITEPADLRMAGFAPAFLSKPDSATVYANPKKSYTVHAYLDTNQDGKISVGELKTKWRDQYNKAAAKSEKKGKPLQVKL